MVMGIRTECDRIAGQIIEGASSGDPWCKMIDELFHKDNPSILWNNPTSLFSNNSSKSSPVSAYKTLNEYIYQKVLWDDENNDLNRLKTVHPKI